MNEQDEIEHKIKSVDVVLSILRSECSAAESLDEKLSIMKCQRHIESIRARLRRELFWVMDGARGAT